MGICGFEPETAGLGFSWAEGGANCDGAHGFLFSFTRTLPAGSSGQRYFNFGEDDDAGAGLEQALYFRFHLLADM